MKKIVFFLCLFLLCGCAQVSDSDIERRLDSIFSRSGESAQLVQNNQTALFSYYLPSDMRETGSDDLSVSMEYSEAKILYNVNVAAIIGSKYYGVGMNKDGFFAEADEIYHRNGFYIDPDKILYPFSFDVYQKGEDYYLTFLSRNSQIYAVSSRYDLTETARHMLLFARGARVDSEAVIQAYSHKDVIDYQKKQVDLFETIIPANGVLEDLVIKDDAIVTQETENDVE